LRKNLRGRFFFEKKFSSLFAAAKIWFIVEKKKAEYLANQA